MVSADMLGSEWLKDGNLLGRDKTSEVCTGCGSSSANNAHPAMPLQSVCVKQTCLTAFSATSHLRPACSMCFPWVLDSCAWSADPQPLPGCKAQSQGAGEAGCEPAAPDSCPMPADLHGQVLAGRATSTSQNHSRMQSLLVFQGSLWENSIFIFICLAANNVAWATLVVDTPSPVVDLWGMFAVRLGAEREWWLITGSKCTSAWFLTAA